MKKVFLLLPLTVLLAAGCSHRQSKQAAQGSLPPMPDTTQIMTNREMVAGAIKNHAIIDTLAIPGKSNIVIVYNPAAAQAGYIAEHYSGVPDTSKYARDRGVDKGQVYFPCIGKRTHSYTIDKSRIISVVSVLTDTYFDRSDYIFMADTIAEVDVWAANASVFINSDIKLIANSPLSAGSAEYQVVHGDSCSFNAAYFNRVLRFCQKNHIKVH